MLQGFEMNKPYQIHLYTGRAHPNISTIKLLVVMAVLKRVCVLKRVLRGVDGEPIVSNINK